MLDSRGSTFPTTKDACGVLFKELLSSYLSHTHRVDFAQQ